MASLFEQITQVFEEQSWAFQPVEGRDVLESGFEAHHGKVQLHVQAFAALNAVSVVSQSPILNDDPDRRVKTAELLMKVNQQLTVGNFEMQWERGETMFRVTNIFPPDRFDGKILTGLVESTVVEMDGLTPLLSAIAKARPAELPILDIDRLLSAPPA